jgi:transcriptional regulator with XRE-family HTH domain
MLEQGEPMPRIGNGSGSKQERDHLRRTMQSQGCAPEQIAAEMALRWGFRPRMAWRHAYGWTQDDVAARYNEILNSGNAPMNGKRISDYENWPRGGQKITLNSLAVLAKVYCVSIVKLVDLVDRQKLSRAELLALDTLAESSEAKNVSNLDGYELIDRRPRAAVRSRDMDTVVTGDAVSRPDQYGVIARQLWSFPPGPIVAVTGEIRTPIVDAQPGLFLLQSRDSLAMVEAVVSVVTNENQKDLVVTSCGAVQQEHLTANLVLVGGPRSNTIVRRVLAELDVPIKISITRHLDGSKTKRIVLPDGKELEPLFDDGVLTRDLALVVTGTNPFESARKVMIFAGLHSYGNHGAVAALVQHGRQSIVEHNLQAIATKQTHHDRRNLALVVEVSVVNGDIVNPNTRPEWIFSF